MVKMKEICWVMVLMVVVSGGWVTSEGEPIGGMVSYWTFDEAEGNTSHDSFGDNDGAVHNAVWTAGQIGGALDFDTTAHVNCGHDNSLDMTDGTTICLWICPDPCATHSSVFLGRGYYDSSTNNKSLISWHRYSEESFGYRIRHDTHEVTIRGPASAGVWQHIAATYQSGTMKFYVNGELSDEATGADLQAEVSQYDLIIGATLAPHSPATSFDGKIDDVAFFNRPLTEEEIQQIYQDGLAGLGIELDYRKIAINKIEGAIATKTEAIELVDLAIEKERAAFLALNDLRDNDQLGELSLMDIFKAKLEILWAMGRQIRAKFSLRRSINRLQRALDTLTLEPDPGHEPPPHPERPVGLRGRGR